MTFSKIGRMVTALVATAALGLGMTACGGGTIGYMWVLGTYYNQITGFKIDQYTGNLTNILNSPFSSGGSNPTSIVVKPGGRFVYVINSGSGGVGVPGAANYVAPAGANVSVFLVGGGGVLTYQQSYASQGVNPLWATLDSTGNFLYVLDKFAPDYATNPSGSITAFAIASDSGRLTLVTNSAVTINNVPTTFFRVGQNPLMTKVSGGCMYTLSGQSVYPLSVNGTTGQLTTTATGAQALTGVVSATSINVSNVNHTYITDGAGNQILAYTPSAACVLSPISGSQQANVAGALNPVNSITAPSGNFLYVINQSSTSSTSTANSTISAFNITSNGQLSTLTTDSSNPYGVGSGPVCLVIDPTNQYLYVSSNNDSTVTGKLIDQNRGNLSDLSRGSVFPTTMKPTCLAISNSV